MVKRKWRPATKRFPCAKPPSLNLSKPQAFPFVIPAEAGIHSTQRPPGCVAWPRRGARPSASRPMDPDLRQDDGQHPGSAHGQAPRTGSGNPHHPFCWSASRQPLIMQPVAPLAPTALHDPRVRSCEAPSPSINRCRSRETLSTGPSGSKPRSGIRGRRKRRSDCSLVGWQISPTLNCGDARRTHLGR